MFVFSPLRHRDSTSQTRGGLLTYIWLSDLAGTSS
jgi:hypothetical protein